MATTFNRKQAAAIVKQGGTIAYPTDTIYGLGCNPFDPEAVERLNAIKQRPQNKSFILLATEPAHFDDLISLSAKQVTTIEQQTDRPTSWVVAADAQTPPWLQAADGSISIRLCQQPDVVELCQRLGHAIVSTSANISGHPPARNALQLHRWFQHRVDKILLSDRPLPGRASRIIRLSDQTIIRE